MIQDFYNSIKLSKTFQKILKKCLKNVTQVKYKQNLLEKIRGIFGLFLENDELHLGKFKQSKFKENVKKELVDSETGVQFKILFS